MMINIDTSKFYVDVIYHKNERWIDKLSVKKGETHNENNEHNAKNRQGKSYKEIMDFLMSDLEKNNNRVNHFKNVL